MLSLNLLPPENKMVNDRISGLRRFYRILWLLNLVWFIGLTGLVAANFLLNQRLDNFRQQRQSLPTADTASSNDISSLTTKLNNTIKILNTNLGLARSWGRDLSVVYSIIPTGNTITDITLSDQSKFVIKGISGTRQNFLILDDFMKKSAALSNISSPSSPTKRTDLPFEYTGLIIPSTK